VHREENWKKKNGKDKKNKEEQMNKRNNQLVKKETRH